MSVSTQQANTVLFKIIIILFLVAMLVSLFSGLIFLAKDDNNSRRTLNALTIRISIWAGLFILLCIGLYTGALAPSNSIKPQWAKQQVESPAE